MGIFSLSYYISIVKYEPVFCVTVDIPPFMKVNEFIGFRLHLYFVNFPFVGARKVLFIEREWEKSLCGWPKGHISWTWMQKNTISWTQVQNSYRYRDAPCIQCVETNRSMFALFWSVSTIFLKLYEINI